MKRLTAVGLLCLLFALAGCKKKPTPTDANTPDGGTPDGASEKPKIAIGKTTTFVTGPLDADGRVDYPAALNARLSKGVTAENNVNVALWKALGPNPSGDAKIPPGFFESLGMAAPPARGDYLIGLRVYCDQHAPGQADATYHALARFSDRPWTDDEQSTLNQWLQANAKPLDALRTAVRRTHYYNPFLPESREKGLGSSLHLGLVACRELAGALTCRAMLRLGRGDATEAWRDLITCHRLGRLVGHGGSLIEALVAIAIEQIVCRAEHAFLDRAGTDAQTTASCLRDLSELPEPRSTAEQIDLTERFWFLDTITRFCRDGERSEPLYDADFRPIKHGLNSENLAGTDWNAALEFGNTSFDRIAAIFREKDRATRVERLTQLQTELRPHYTRFIEGSGAAALERASSSTERGRLLGQMFFSTAISLLGKVNDAVDRRHQIFDNTVLAFALVRYQRTTGAYPDTLARLTPTYLTTIPGDVFSGKGLIYQPDATGFLLYSVGPNGADDGGLGLDAQPPRDDIGVRLPMPHKP